MSKVTSGEALRIPTRLLVESTFSVLVSTVTSPVTVRAPKVPTLVMLVCAAVSTEPVKLPATLPVTSPVKSPVTLPVTLPVRLPVTLPVSGALTAANVGLSPVATPWFRALTAVILVSSLSIKAPAAVTLAVSVTSALASIPSSLDSSESVKALVFALDS